MLDKKYYTPKIEEFHVGFEYDVFQKGQPTDSNYMYFMEHESEDKWFSYKFPDPFLGYRLDKIFDKYTIRVKYLDKEDMESLGFLQSKNDEYWFDYKNDRFWMYKENENDEYWHINDEESQFGFSGKIKNKSELIKLLKQLGINE